MKKNIIFLTFCLIFASCSEDWLETKREGGTITAETKVDAESKSEHAREAAAREFGATMIDYTVGLGDLGFERQNDFGWAALCMLSEVYGQDFVGDNDGYNWFQQSLYPNNRDNTLNRTEGYMQTMNWTIPYKLIRIANDLLESIDLDNPGNNLSTVCIAKTYRAFAYLHLAQCYQFTYVGNETKPCVPIVKEGMTQEQKSNNPRATVQAVYDLIMEDLNYAIENFGSYVPADKSIPGIAVAYGLRARANLIMQKYDKASADAQACLDASKATPLSIEECEVPGFASADASNVIWANIISTNNTVVQTGICNWVSMLTSWYDDGYGAVTKKYIDSDLYDKIPDTDVRKCWWNDKDGKNKMFTSGKLSPSFTQYVDGTVYGENAIGDSEDYAYVMTKFGTGDNTISGASAAAGDWILMRAEEMELIIAECDNTGEKLKTFVTKYRDPSYTPTGDVKEDVWLQRRIELWGEGFAFFDLLRLNKGVERKAGTNWPDAWIQTIPAGDKQLLYQIPEREITANQGISDSDNNPL